MVLKNPPLPSQAQPKQVTKPQASPKLHLKGLTKGQLCKLIFKHEEMERQRIGTIQQQQKLISSQGIALVWQAEGIGQVAKHFPAIQEKKEFKGLLELASDLVTQAEQLKSFQEKEKTDGTSSEETGKSRKRLPKAGDEVEASGADGNPGKEGTEPLRDADPEREADSLPAQSGGADQSGSSTAGR